MFCFVIKVAGSFRLLWVEFFMPSDWQFQAETMNPAQALETGPRRTVQLTVKMHPAHRKKVLMHPQGPSTCSLLLPSPWRWAYFSETIGLNKYTFSGAWAAATTCKHLLDTRNNSLHEERRDVMLWYAFKTYISLLLHLKKKHVLVAALFGY